MLLAVLAITLVWSAILVKDQLAGEAPLVERIDAAFTELWFHAVGPRPAPAGVTVVALDEETTAAFGYPLPRLELAILVERLADAGVAGVALDLLLVDAKDPAGDQRLADAMTRVPVVLAAAAQFRPDGETTPGDARPLAVSTASDLMLPLPLFRGVAGVGLVNVGTEPGGAVGSIPLLVEFDGRLVPSLALRTVAAAGRFEPGITSDGLEVAGRTVPLDRGAVLPLRFFGPRGTVPTISAARLIRDPRLAEALRGQVVLIGSTVFGSGDTFATPYDPALPGAEVLGTAILHLLNGQGLTRTASTRRIDAAAAMVLPLLGLLPALTISAALGAAAALIGMAGWMLVAFVAFTSGVSLSVAGPLATCATTLPLWVASRLWLDHRLRQRLEAEQARLTAFQEPVLARLLIEQPDFMLEPVQQLSAVLFVDLSGFTGLSETIGLRRTRDLLQDFHTRVADIVRHKHGVMLGFMGDGAMAVFGVVEPSPADAAHAIGAACDLAADIAAWIPTRGAESLEGVRIGAHYGPVILSRIGSARHQHITAMGDTVNVASRLLDVAKHFGRRIAVSAALAEAARKVDAGLVERAGFGAPRAVEIRGRRDRVSVCLR